ncbi:MAG TPA: phosphotransferase [Galbitalea sp.]|jgi:trehalose synthase-fused probable maltokinase|nr:phosphotransferase [Galbitalea sp.]
MAEEALPPELEAWMTRQRWYAGKGSTAGLTRISGWSLAVPVSGGATAQLLVHFVLCRQPSGATLYQVPIMRRDAALSGADEIWHDGSGYFYDGPRDPAYAPAILGLIASESEVGGARGHRQPGAQISTVTSSTVLTGEQSNTSIICTVASGPPVILKVFRALHAGDNPDVVLQSAISATGSALVPASIGFLSGQWADRSEPEGLARGHLAFAQEFLEGAEDGWRRALKAATAGEDFSLSARRLGTATAELHATLATALPTRAVETSDVDRFLDGMRFRAASAFREIPELARHREEIELVIGAARTATWPDLQRIHGDFHLGQVLGFGDKWVMVDFEGEPLRPMPERSAPDLPLRDVAGMLRSFDYVAGAVLLYATGGGPGGVTEPALSPLEWARTARIAFLAGYSEAGTADLTENRGLLDALELDKALYEAVYEARNRPDWLGIPVEAVLRLAAA